MGLEKILADLERHERSLDLTLNGLGDGLLTAAENGVRQTFAAQTGPDGSPWPELSAEYARHKAKHWPGKPTGVRDEVMIGGLSGERSVTPTEAVWTFGTTEDQRREVHWFSEGDETRNRPPRPVVGLTDVSRMESSQMLQDHLKDSL